MAKWPMMKKFFTMNRYSLANFFSITIILQLCTIALSAQEPGKKIAISGYISSLQSTTFDSIQKNWETGNLVHNRLNLKWYPTGHLSAALEARNRLAFGESIELNPGAADSYAKDYGVLDLTTNIFHGKSYVLNTSVDRLWFAFEKNKWRITLGRQRINWSQTWVWNPNDIFNAYSFFDFDYVERPGSDALRIQYYNNEVSVTEFAMKMNNQHRITAAGYYKFNKWNYDFQFIGGILNETDYVAGIGWSGAIKSMAVRGEMSYFRPVRNFSDTTGLFLTSIAVDYTFGNSLMLMAEFLYNSNPVADFDNFLTFYNAPLTVKNLSFVKYNLLMQASCPITPLLSGTLAGMYFPQIQGYYIGPSLSYSASDNIEFGLFTQSFGGKTKNETGKKQKIRYNLIFLRAKVSF
jgi:hypothetical protein